MTDYISEPPLGLPLSTKVKGLRKAYEDAKAKLDKYRTDNARYRTRDVSMIGEYKARYSTPALEDARAELKNLEIIAVQEGKALPNKGVFLGTVQAKIDEYDRTVSALEVLVTRSRKAYDDGVRSELVPMGLAEAKAAQKARDAWEKAWKAAMEAKGTLEKHAGLFAWCATAGGIDTPPLEGASAGNKVEYWELSADGRLTTEAAIEMGYEGLSLVDGLVVMPEPVIDEQAEAEAEFWRTYKPKMFIAKPEGYGDNWEH